MNSLGTYGLGTASPRAGGGGENLMTLSSGTKRSAMGTIGDLAGQEAKREIFNKQAEQEAKAGNAQLGSTLGGLGGMAIGAQYGAAGGPWGAAIGAIVGGVAGGLFD